MKTIIMLKNVNQIDDFVEHAQKIDGDVIVQRGRNYIDGKSIDDMYHFVNLTEPIIISFPDDESTFTNYIRQFFLPSEIKFEKNLKSF